MQINQSNKKNPEMNGLWVSIFIAGKLQAAAFRGPRTRCDKGLKIKSKERKLHKNYKSKNLDLDWLKSVTNIDMEWTAETGKIF